MLEIALLSALGIALGVGLFIHFSDDADSSAGETLEGTEDNDTLTGTERDDLLMGLDGHDTLIGGGGDDTLKGGDGADAVIGGAGNDLMRGEAGNDALFGLDGDDRIAGDTGADWIEGGAGADTIKGGYGGDLLAGGTGADSIDGGANGDLLIGGEGPIASLDTTGIVDLRDDLMDGLLDDPSDWAQRALADDGDTDTMDGGDGDDILIGGSGDVMTGGEGEDLFVLLDAAGVDPAVITDYDADQDALVCQYAPGQPEPVLELSDNGDGTSTLSADGIALAVLNAGSLSVADVLLIQRPT